MSETEKLFRVIDTRTGLEADDQAIVLQDTWAQDLLYHDVDCWSVDQYGSLGLMDDTGVIRYPPECVFVMQSALKDQVAELTAERDAARLLAEKNYAAMEWEEKRVDDHKEFIEMLAEERNAYRDALIEIGECITISEFSKATQDAIDKAIGQ